MSQDCIGNIKTTKPKGVLIQYAPTSSGTWSESILGAFWIRFSTNNGATWSAPRKFVGTDGADALNQNSYELLYNYLGSFSTPDTITGTDVFDHTYNVLAGTLVNDGDFIQITSIYELTTDASDNIESRLGVYLNLASDNNAMIIDNWREVNFMDISGQIYRGNTRVKLITTISKNSDSTAFVEFIAIRSGQPGTIEDTPEIKAIQSQFSFTSEDLKIITGATNTGTPSMTARLHQFKVELFKITV